jgi:VWFA-related protein
MRTRRGGWICVFCLSLVSGFAQESGLAGGSATPASAGRPMTLDVAVMDKAGRPVSGLQQEDFTVLDNKLPQKILSFDAVTAADPPVEVILLLDEVNIQFTKLGSEREQIERFLGGNGGALPHPVLLVFFGDSGLTFGSGPSRDGNALIAELRREWPSLRTIGKSQGLYGDQERLHLSIHALQRLIDYGLTRPGRKLVVWVSPGWPIIAGPDLQLTYREKQGIFVSVVNLSAGLREARISLYAVDPLGLEDAAELRTSEYKQYLKGVKRVGQAQMGDVALQVLAAQSGGRVLNSSNDVAGEIAASIADANASYILSFDSLPGNAPNEYHALEIRIDKLGLAARTRSGYYAQPEPALKGY